MTSSLPTYCQTHANGSIYWYCGDKLHRLYGPAVQLADGGKMWYYYGVLHREDGPAVVYPCGEQAWYYNGQRHREGAPAWIKENGDCEWHENGVLHREDGPARTWADRESTADDWYRHGQPWPEGAALMAARKEEEKRKMMEAVKDAVIQPKSSGKRKPFLKPPKR